MNRRAPRRAEGHRRETEAQREVGGERALPGPPGASKPNPGFPASQNSRPNSNPALQLAQRRGWSLKGSRGAPDPSPEARHYHGDGGCASAKGLSDGPQFKWPPGPRAWPGREGRSPGDSISGARSERSCEPGRYQDWVAGKVRARALGRIRSRRHSSVSALLKGRGYFIPPTQRLYFRQSSAPALKGN